jgi:hypothetical protein
VTPTTLPLNQKMRKSTVFCTTAGSRQRTLEELYLRRATLMNLISSLEIYDRTSKRAAMKVVTMSR